MLFNVWRQYPRRKPKEDGLYLCKEIGLEGQIHINELFYRTNDDKWIEMSRQSVFDSYIVYKKANKEVYDDYIPFLHTNHPLYTRVYTDCICERYNVVAWKQLIKIKE